MASIGEGNVGDEAILDGVIKRLRDRGDVEKIVVFSHNVSESRSWHSGADLEFVDVIPTGARSFLRSLKGERLKRTLDALNSVDCVIVGGGGIFYDLESSVGMNPLAVWLIRFLFIKSRNKKIVIHSVGVGPIKKDISKFYLKKICRKADQISVRDQASFDLMKKLKIKDIEKVMICHDPVWDLELESSEEKKRQAVFIVREMYGVKAWRERAVEVFAKLADYCSSELSLDPVFMPFSFRHPDDRDFINDIIEKQKKSKAKVFVPEGGVDDWYKELSGSSLVLSMRLHGQIFALKAGVPLVALSYSQKTTALAKEYVSDMKVIDAKDLKPDKLKKELSEARVYKIKEDKLKSDFVLDI